MKIFSKIVGLALIAVLVFPHATFASTLLGQRLAGKLLLQVEDRGRIWYVAPQDFKRYEVTFKNALPLFENFALGITNKDLQRIDSDLRFAGRLHGKLLLQVEDRGRIWYVDFNGKRHEVTWENLLPLFESLSLGITNSNLNKIQQSVVVVINDPQNNSGTETIPENTTQEPVQGTETSQPDNTNEQEQQSNNSTVATGDAVLHNFVNDYRTDLGLSALIVHTDLCNLVDERIEEIKLDFSHAGFERRGEDGSFDFLKYRSIGENLFMANFGDETTAIDGWHNSPGHRDNMRGDWTHACSKLVDGYGVSLFMKL